MQSDRLGGVRSGLLESPGLHCRIDEVEHIVAHLNVVRWKYPRRADLDRGLIRRLVVALGQRDPYRDPLRNKEIHLQASRAGPVGYLGGVSTRGIQLAPPRGEHPEVGQEMVAKQFPALGPLCHR
jgi:hypothetical protein